MKLVITNSELQELVDKRLIAYEGDKKYSLVLNNNRSNLRKIDIEVVTTTGSEEIPVLPEAKVALKKDEIEAFYKKYMNAFPNDINVSLGIKGDGISLRTGSKSKIIDRLKARIADGYTEDDIISAVTYEVWYRTKLSLKKTDVEKDNDLQYMKRAESWINSVGNIDNMIARSKSSSEFNDVKQVINNEAATRQNIVKSKIL